MPDNAAAGPRVIVALDYPDAAQALALVERLDPAMCRLKVGKELFTRSGPQLVETLQQRDFEVFLDLKFHDIPNTVAKACQAAAELGVWMVNIHTLGGSTMMQTAREALEQAAGPRPWLIGVTILTSMGETDLAEIGLTGSPADNVSRLAALARTAGLDGVVCSPHESARLTDELGRDFVLVTPGVRPAGAAVNDQQRIMTPAEALEAGSDYLVIGRPITQAEDPQSALEKINAEIQA